MCIRDRYSSASGYSFGDFIDTRNLPLQGFIQTYFIEDGQAVPSSNPSQQASAGR